MRVTRDPPADMDRWKGDFMRMRWLTAVAVVLVASLALGLLAGCGGGTTTYTNDEYGFSFDYDSGVFTESTDTSAAGSAGGDSVFKIGFFDENGTKQGDQFRDGFLINIYKLNVKIDESLMPAVADEIEKLLPELGKAFGSGATFSDLTEVKSGNVMGFKTDSTYEMEGTPFKATMYFLFNGDIQYQLTFQAADDRWSELEPSFKQVMDTFTVTGEGEPEPAPT